MARKKLFAAVAAAAGKKTPGSADIEAAMTEAVAAAQAEGITDPDKIRARMLAARDLAKQG